MIFIILLAALIVRLITLNQSLWLDEAINVVNSQKFTFWNFLTVYSLGDFHPPLYFGLLWIWTRIFGISEIAVRIPSVIFGIGTVWFTYLIGKDLFNKKTALISALILALNPLHVYYSQEARMYSLAAFSVAFSFWALINLIKETKYSLLFYSLSVVLVLYSDYLVYFALIAQFVYVIWLERKSFKKVIAGMIIGGIFWLPWLLVFPSQLKTGQSAATQIPGWANIVGGANFKELALLWIKSIIGRVSFDNKLVYGMIISSISLIYGFILLKAIKPVNKEIKLILLWIIIPVGFAFIISFYIPIFAYFRMIFILPALSILLAKGIDQTNGKYQKVFIGSVLIVSMACLLLYYLNPKFQREDWKNAISLARDSQLVIFEDNNIPAPAQYYGCNENCYPGLVNFPAKEKSDLNNIAQLTKDLNKIYLFDYLVEISDQQTLIKQQLESLGYKNIETKDFNGVGFVYEYTK